MYKHFESAEKVIEYVKEIINGKRLWKVNTNVDILWRKPRDGEDSVHWCRTGKTTITIEVFEPYEED